MGGGGDGRSRLGKSTPRRCQDKGDGQGGSEIIEGGGGGGGGLCSLLDRLQVFLQTFGFDSILHKTGG